MLRWKDNIEINLQAVGRGGMDLFDLVQDRDRWRVVENVTRNFRVP